MNVSVEIDSYDLSFYIAGIIIIFSGAILVMLPAFQHVKSRMSAPNGRDSLETGMLSKEENQAQQQQQGRATFVRVKESTSRQVGCPLDKTISSTRI